VALDAAARGLSVVLVESHDFAKGTSSRATKLAHGGVRYLAQGNIALVREALHERTRLLANAPHVAQRLPFVMPGYHWWERGFYGVGLKAYDALAGRRAWAHRVAEHAARTLELLPGVKPAACGAACATGTASSTTRAWRAAGPHRRAARRAGAQPLQATGLLREAGQVRGLQVRARRPGRATSNVRARCVVNATGVWVDAVRDMDREAGAPQRQPMVAPSQGVHLIVDRKFLPGSHALLVPKTADGRVMFAVPWLGKTILGTTDTPREDLAREPEAFCEDVGFILREAGALPGAGAAAQRRALGLGGPAAAGQAGGRGRRQHQGAVARAHGARQRFGPGHGDRRQVDDLPQHGRRRAGAGHGRAACCRKRPGRRDGALPLLGARPAARWASRRVNTSTAAKPSCCAACPAPTNWLWRDAGSGQGGLSEAMVRFAARYEMARDVEDVLARRSPPAVPGRGRGRRARPSRWPPILAEELGAGFDAARVQGRFVALAERYATLP
jgi:glycerol-3-phosphate dehydrogenase